MTPLTDEQKAELQEGRGCLIPRPGVAMPSCHEFKDSLCDCTVLALLDEIEALKRENAEQATLNGKGSEREARLMAQVEELKRERDAARDLASARGMASQAEYEQLLASQGEVLRLREALKRECYCTDGDTAPSTCNPCDALSSSPSPALGQVLREVHGKLEQVLIKVDWNSDDFAPKQYEETRAFVLAGLALLAPFVKGEQ
jgi:hypothetical protein